MKYLNDKKKGIFFYTERENESEREGKRDREKERANTRPGLTITPLSNELNLVCSLERDSFTTNLIFPRAGFERQHESAESLFRPRPFTSVLTRGLIICANLMSNRLALYNKPLSRKISVPWCSIGNPGNQYWMYTIS